jgi:type II secretory pathway pseudopilin PulG
MRPRRAVVLLETVLAIALFVIAGTAIMALAQGSLTGLERTRMQERATEVARSAMAKLDAGLETERTLNGPIKAAPGTVAPAGQWELKIDSAPSQFPGLTIVSVTARQLGAGGAVLASHTLRQLVRLGDLPKDRPGEDDPMSAMGAPAAPDDAKEAAPPPRRRRGR